MNLQEFISKFASQFEDEDPSVFTADTDYHGFMVITYRPEYGSYDHTRIRRGT